MKKVTIIIGKQGAGKSTFARDLTKNSKTLWLQNLQGNFLRDIDADINFIVIDELTKKDLPMFKELITCTKLTFRPPYAKNNITIDRPEVIGITNSLTKDDFIIRPHMNFIEK